jgi:outer membrane protein TolC
LPPEFSSFYVATIHTEALTASKILWTWGKLEAQRELAQLGVNAARQQSAVTRLALGKLARESLLALIHTERLLDVDLETLATLMEHQRVTDKRYREGLIAFFEVAQAEAEVAEAQSLAAERRALIERQRVGLRRVLGVEQTVPVQASENGLPEAPALSLQECIEHALEHRPEMAQARAAVRLQEAVVRVARMSLQPSVVVTGQVQEQSASFATTPITYQVVVAFEKPIFDGGARKAEVSGARARLESARLQLEQVAQLVAAEVADGYVQIDQLSERITAAESGTRSAREQLRIARLRFEEDVGTGFEVLNAQGAVAASRTTRANAQLDLHIALSGLLSAMGMQDLQEGPE